MPNVFLTGKCTGGPPVYIEICISSLAPHSMRFYFLELPFRSVGPKQQQIAF